MFVDESKTLKEATSLDVRAGILTIPYGTKVIGEGAIKNIERLSTIIIPSSVVLIETHAVQNTGVVHLEIPSSVKNIQNEAFSDNDWLTTLVITNPKTEFRGDIIVRCRSINVVQIGQDKYLVRCLEGNLPYHILAKHQIDVYQVFYAKLFRDDSSYEKFYFAQKRDSIGKGNTLQEAMGNCHNAYLSQEIVDSYRDISLDSMIGIDDYRRITGACPNGAQEWLKQHEFTVEDKKPVREVIKLIENERAIGSRLFMQFIADRYKDRANGEKYE